MRATSEGVFDDATVVVVPVPVRSVRVSPDSAVVVAGSTTTYTAQTFDSIGGVLTGRVVRGRRRARGRDGRRVTGVVTGVAAGTTTVRATSEGVFDDATVRVTSTAARPSRWRSGANGNWSDAARWSRGAVPVAGDSAVIDVAGTYTVTRWTSIQRFKDSCSRSSGVQTLSGSFPDADSDGCRSRPAERPAIAGKQRPDGHRHAHQSRRPGGRVSTIAAALVNEGLLRLRAIEHDLGALTTTASSTLRLEGDGTCCAATTTVSNGFVNNGLIELTAINAGTSAQLIVTAGTLTNAVGATISSAVGTGGARFLNATLTTWAR